MASVASATSGPLEVLDALFTEVPNTSVAGNTVQEVISLMPPSRQCSTFLLSTGYLRHTSESLCASLQNMVER